MSEKETAYRVLARKYRPQNFDQLIGQDALVRTLKNAIDSGRVAHAFMLTGVRGVGKTTTARIIARAINYTGADGKAGPTTGPTDDCNICKAIAEDRHPDVMEMDAASRTGVDDIREILDGVRYAPTEARYKVYIIDEVHMLSKNAFNALLKTLEEPPPHVKFIFATTEIRKVPVTILSRCQRFDLRRVEVDVLRSHFANVCEKENMKIEDEAVAMIARAADGSVRDGLSILDQAMALSQGIITADLVKSMLGLSDRAALLDLFEQMVTGDATAALTTVADLYRAGADAAQVIQDLLDITHLLSKFQAAKAAPATVEPNMASSERARAADMAARLTMPVLGRLWQILLKGLQDVQLASNAQSTAEIVILRACYAAHLPDPEKLLRDLQGGVIASASSSRASSSAPPPTSVTARVGNAVPLPSIPPRSEPVAIANNNLETLRDVVALLEQDGALTLAAQVYQFVELERLEQNRLDVHIKAGAHAKLSSELSARLSKITGQRWMVTLVNNAAQPTLQDQDQLVKSARLEAVRADALVEKLFTFFPEAKIITIGDDNV
jgi:DNA polymerase III subunit gamma/tau